MALSGVVVKDSGSPDLSQKFGDKGRRDVLILETAAIGLGIYQPGWRWSLHARPSDGGRSQTHVGYVISGAMVSRGPDGVEVTLAAGDAFEAPPGHDAWVVGDEPCVALDFTAITRGASEAGQSP